MRHRTEHTPARRLVTTAALATACLIVDGASLAIHAQPPATTPASAQAPPATAQPAATPRVAFALATIKPNKVTGPREWKSHPGGRFTATNVPLLVLVRLAYGFQLVTPQQQGSPGPSWIANERFDIEAQAPEGYLANPDGTAKQVLAMLRSLLEDRFNVKTHIEERELPIYSLVVAHKDGKLGPDLKVSELDCSPGAPPPANGQKCGVSNEGGALVGRGFKIGALAAFLSVSPAVGRIVRDDTGLTAVYDMRLHFARPFVQGPGGGAAPNPDVDSAPNIFTALQEQLGLKLESVKAPMRVFHIDSVDPLAPEQ
jgi:uncharacterized protein (TIGR03435 family)